MIKIFCFLYIFCLQHGVFATKDEEYFVEPLWNDTHNIDTEGHFHIVYKRSALKAMYKESQCGVQGG